MNTNGSIATLRGEHQRILRSLRCRVTDGDYARLAVKAESVRELARIENRDVSLYDINRKRFIVKTDRHLALLGYEAPREIDVNDMDAYHALVHEDDLPFLYDTEIKTFRFLRGVTGREKKNFKLVYDYRVRGRSGRPVRFLHQLSLFELDRRLNSWILLTVSDVLSEHPGDERPNRFLVNTVTGKTRPFDGDRESTALLTGREREVLALIARGCDSREIASRLDISPHTVNNHRQHILEKTGARHAAQAIAYAKSVGLL